MKTSRFNHYRRNGLRTAIYNAASGRGAAFSWMEAKRLKAGQHAGLPPAELEKAQRIGALVPSEIDEDRLLQARYHKRAHDTSSLSVIAVLTYRCNLRCPYCFEDDQLHRGPRMDGSMIERLVKAIKARCERDGSRRLSVMLFGGEPLLMPNAARRILGELSAWCRREGREFRGSMSSNGALMRWNTMARLAPFLDVVQLTFDGPQRIHDRIRIAPGGAGTYEKIVRSIRMLVALGIGVHVRIQVSHKTRDTLPELLADLEQRGILGLEKVAFSLAVLREYSHWSCEEHTEPVEPGSELERELLGRYAGLLPPPTPAVQILPCIVSGNLLCVGPRGELYKCITTVGQPEHEMGRITEDGDFELDDAFYDFAARDPWSFAGCRQCAHLPLCGGGCPIEARAQEGTYHAPCCDGLPVLETRIDNLLGGRR